MATADAAKAGPSAASSWRWRLAHSSSCARCISSLLALVTALDAEIDGLAAMSRWAAGLVAAVLALPTFAPLREIRGAGIGVVFNTRKGNFQYKISLYIIIYLDYIIVYHVYHDHVSHISCPSSTHDISLVSSFFLRHVISCDLMSRF